MKTVSTIFCTFSVLLNFAVLLLPAAASTQNFQLVVQNGYGSGTYAAGDTVHVWAKECAANQTFDKWTGQTNALRMPDEWHTWLVMPAHNVQVTANLRTLPPGTTFTEENFRGRDTIKQVFHYFPPGGLPKGVVWLFHGTGGSAEAWVNSLANFEQEQFSRYLVADTLAVIVLECEERTKNFDTSGDGNIRWEYTFDSVANVDIANIRAVRDTFIHRGWMNWNTPQIAAGFSAGGSFSTLISPMLGWKLAINHNTPGVQPIIELTTNPILFSMSWRDNHPEIGVQGNIDAFQNYQYLLDKGNCTEFYMQFPSPVYPERFLRMPGISLAKAQGVFNELQSNGCLNAKNFLLKSPAEVVALVIANPQNWPTLLSMTAQQRDFANQEIEVMWSAHHFNNDFAGKDLHFINNACTTTAATELPKNKPELNISPNPADQYINLPEDTETVRVFDLNGKLVLGQSVAGVKQLDVSLLHKGFYLLETGSSKGRQMGKFIKQ